jgi:hypothetical protein
MISKQTLTLSKYNLMSLTYTKTMLAPHHHPETRLMWLWKQYQLVKNTTHGLEPPTQSFETKIVWLYQRYKYRIPKNDPLKRAQYTIPTPILDLLITTFNINHSYFSSPVTCPTQFTQFYSPFSRDIIFGSLGKAFHHKWQGIGYAHPTTQQTYNKPFNGLAWRPKMTHIQSLYLYPRILIGTKTLTRTHVLSWTHTSLPTLPLIRSHMKNPQYPPNSILQEENHLPYKYFVSTTKTIT